MALAIVIGMTISMSFETLSTVAMAIAPKATCDRPSPMNERRFKTSVTPSRDEHSAISTPAISA